MLSEIVWDLKKDAIRRMIKSGKRSDDRKLDEYRQIDFIADYVPRAEGSCLAKLGDTQVLVGIKTAVLEPYPDTPDQGTMSVGCELGPLASPNFQTGPPDAISIEIARVVDRGVRESKMLNADKLCITPKEKVWNVFIDIHLLDDHGNMIDAASLAAVKALLGARFPKYDGEKITYGEKAEALPIQDKPVSSTFAKVDGIIILDPSYEEEKAMDARFTVVTDQNENICAIQKGGTGSFLKSEIEYIVETAIKRGNEMRKLL